jgi:hypothetical protein
VLERRGSGCDRRARELVVCPVLSSLPLAAAERPLQSLRSASSCAPMILTDLTAISPAAVTWRRAAWIFGWKPAPSAQALLRSKRG